MFRTNASVDDVARAVERSPSTVWGYLVEFIAQNPEQPLDTWVPADVAESVNAAAAEVGGQYLKPVFEKLGGNVRYEQIRLVLARNRQ